MKKLNIWTYAAIFMLMGQFAVAQSIVGSAHDFADDTWNTSGQICLVCHTPHNADVSVSNAPLWNHEKPRRLHFQLTPAPLWMPLRANQTLRLNYA